MKPSTTSLVKNILGGKGKIHKSIDKLKNNTNSDDFLEAYELLSKTNPEIEAHLVGNLWASDWNSVFGARSYIKFRKSQRSLSQTTSILLKFHSEISSHVEIRNTVWKHSLQGEWNEIINIVSKKHEPIFGKTVWGIYWLLMSVNNSTEKHRNALNTIIESEVQEPFLKFTIGVFRLAQNKNIIEDTYQSIVRDSLGKYDEDFFDYFNLLNLQEVDLKCSTSELLSFTEKLPVIDRYEFIVNYCIHGIPSTHVDSEMFSRVIVKLSAGIRDDALQNVVDLVSNSSKFEVTDLDRSLNTAWDAYLQENYADSKAISRNIIEHRPDIFVAHELFVKSCIYLEKAPRFEGEKPINLLWRALSKIYIRGSDTDESLRQLSRFATQFRIPSLSYPIRSLHSISNSEVVFQQSIEQAPFFEGVHNPRKFDYSAWNHRKEYLEKYSTSFKSHNADFFSWVSSSENSDESRFSNIPPLRIKFFLAFSAFRECQYPLAALRHQDFLKLYSQQKEFPFVPFAIEESRRQLTQIYLLTENLDGVIKLAENTIAEGGIGLRRLPLKEIYGLFRKNRKTASASISYPIVSGIVNSDPHSVTIDLKKYLKNKKVDKPSELCDGIQNNFPIEYLLFRVCSTEVLDSLPSTDTPSKVETERLKCLEWVSEVSSAFGRQAEEEMLRLTQSIQLNKALLQMEGARVVLNMSALRDAEHQLLHEAFSEYHAKSSLARSRTADEIIHAIKHVQDSAGEERPILFLDTANFLEHFVDFANKVVNVFLSSPHFGLEACLSSRIRHGVIVQHIRRPLTESKISISGNSPIETELIQEWRDRFKLEGNSKELQNVIRILRRLTLQIDEVSTEIKNTWIQSTIEDNHDALFNYCFSETEFNEVFSGLELPGNSEDSFNENVDAVFRLLTDRTRNNLEKIQKKVDEEVPEKLMAATEVAIQQVSELENSEVRSYFRDSIVRAQSDFERVVEQMKRWFQPDNSSLTSDVDLLLVASTAVGMAEYLNPQFQGKHIVMECSEGRILEHHFTTIVHIIFYLLDNGIRHSQTDIQIYRATLSIKIDKDYLCLEVSNTTQSAAEAKKAAKTINKKVYENFRDLDPDKINKEGGTGFAKIMAAIMYEFKEKKPLIEASHSDTNLIINIRTLFYGLVKE